MKGIDRLREYVKDAPASSMGEMSRAIVAGMAGESAARWYSDKLRDAHRIERKLMDENAKLRELVRHLRECTRHNVCAACEYADDVCDFDYDMHELGVDA